MEKVEVIILVRTIKENYPGFDKSAENIERLHKYLYDFPFQTAKENVDAHIMTEKFPPNVAEIRGRMGEQREHERLKAETAEYFAKRDAARAAAVLPPPGWKEEIYAKLGYTGATE